MKKGFTLIELIAVIVILAIITLIAVPIISKVVDKARKGAAEASALNYIDAVEKYVILHDLDSTKYPYDLKNNTFNVSSNTEISLLDIIIPKAKAEGTVPPLNNFIIVKGDKPKSGTITLNEKGKVTEAEFGFGKYNVECTGNSCSASKNIITLSIVGEDVLELGVNETITLSVETNSKDSISWSSNNTDIVTVDNGSVKAHKSGTAIVIAQINNVKAEVTINVVDINLSISGDAERNLYIGNTLELVASSDYDAPILWSSSDDSVATVNNGVVTPIKKGVAIISASQKGSKANVTINVLKTGPTKVDAMAGETHKGIVYLNPNSPAATCNHTNSTVGSGTGGCMKWYIFKETSDKYYMILDHNAANHYQWIYYSNSVPYNQSYVYNYINSLNWDSSLNKRIIKVSEVQAITNKPNIDLTVEPSYSWYYFDSNNQTKTTSGKGTSKYAWLFDYTNLCVQNGCNNEINVDGGDGYWTDHESKPTNRNWYALVVNKEGQYRCVGTEKWYGIRPVIEVSKNLF